MRIMAIGAHPDDIEIYMFGALAAWLDRGSTIDCVVATDGALGGQEDRLALSAARKAEATKAAAMLDAEPVFLDFPDGGLVADDALLGALKQIVSQRRPDLVVTHAQNDYHGDHRVLSGAVSAAASFHAPVLYADTLNGTGFDPTHYVDTSGTMERKRAAVLLHASQNPQRFVPVIERLGRFRSSQCNNPDGFAEAYKFEPRFPFADIRDLLPPAPPIAPMIDRSRHST